MRILTVVGARPQFVKAAAVSRALKATHGIEELIVHTGQHFDANMSDIFFSELEIPAPRYNLDIHGGRHGDMTGRMIMALEPVMLEAKPDIVLLYGDTNSTLAGAIVAAKLKLPVAHVEAGVRMFDRGMPEEINRVLTDHISTWLFCPTRSAVGLLEREGISRGVHFVGDVMYDATLFAIERARTASPILEHTGLKSGHYAIATVHRAENTDDPQALAAILAWLKTRAREHPVAFPIHPRTRKVIAASGFDTEGLMVMEPVGYFDMARMLDGAVAVYTDSGGLQKEAYFHRKPCVTLSPGTAWTETIEAGWNRLWREPEYRAPRVEIPDYGTGDAAMKIARIIGQAAR